MHDIGLQLIQYHITEKFRDTIEQVQKYKVQNRATCKRIVGANSIILHQIIFYMFARMHVGLKRNHQTGTKLCATRRDVESEERTGQGRKIGHLTDWHTDRLKQQHHRNTRSLFVECSRQSRETDDFEEWSR